jgi:signal transduction histidine kinase
MTELLAWKPLRIAAAILAFVLLSLVLLPVPISKLISANEFLPHATCYLRNERLIWLHASSDLVIGLSYVAISSTLAYLVFRARREIPFHWMFLAFGLFIITCGFTHFMEVWTVWQPVYWLSGYVKIVTGIASASTAIFLPTLVPKVIRLIREARLSTERKIQLEQLNEELSGANEELKAFTYSASHDLRAPLRTMNSMSTLLLETLPENTDPEARQFATRIQNGAYRMNQLLDDLLAYSAFYKLDTPISKFSPAPIIEEIISEFETDIKHRKAQVSIQGVMPDVTANPTLLKMVLSNLIANAVKYVPEDRVPRVEISAHNAEGLVEISVKDNGPGIPPQFRQKIFEPFERLHRDQSGTGLGLAIVMRGIQKMRGQAGVEPNPEGTGSRFWVRLPAA